MDLFKQASAFAKGSSQKPVAGQPAAGQPGQPGQVAGQPAAGTQDYGDKAFSAGYKKFSGGKEMDKNTSEKITDGARGMFEKFTGKKVPAKYSN